MSVRTLVLFMNYGLPPATYIEKKTKPKTTCTSLFTVCVTVVTFTTDTLWRHINDDTIGILLTTLASLGLFTLCYH